MCLAQNIVNPATVADHIIPHLGDPGLFWHGELQSLCEPHHKGAKQQIETKGFSSEVGLDGWPVDPNHPANSNTTEQPYSIPHHVRPSAIPVHIVCGAPGAGKTTYVRTNAKPKDVIIDLDDIRQRIGTGRYDTSAATRRKAFGQRGIMIRSLADRREGEAWLTLLAPTQAERKAWLRALGARAVMYELKTPADVCKSRIMADPTREGETDRLCRQVDAYFAKRGRNTSKDPTGGAF
jgi:5-methylcytosine-specific restriction protein A